MKKIVSLIIVLAMVCPYHVGYTQDNALSIYVSANGSDSNNGLSDSKPLKTLSAVTEKISDCKKGDPTRDINVYFAQGTYYVDEICNLDNAEGITYQAAEGDEVIFKGSTILDANEFTLVTDTQMLNRLPESARGKVYKMDLGDKFTAFCEPEIADHGNDNKSYYQLYKNNEEQVLARYPNTGYMSAEAVGADEIKIPAQKAELWSGAQQTIRLNGFLCWDWCYIRNYIKDIDTDKSTIKFDIARTCSQSVSKTNKFFVNDLLEELDIPGEWYIDRNNKILYYYPENETDLDDIYEISSLQTEMMRFYNAKNITFKNLKFENTCECAVNILSSSDILFENCTFKNIGRTAIETNSVSNMTVNGCDFYNMGVRGITVDGGDSDTLTASNNKIINNSFEKMGQVQRSYAGAVNIIGDGNTVANNRITDMPHLAIQFVGTNNKIIYNDISRVCRESGDMGAVYSGRSLVYRGNSIAYNYIHDVVSEWSDYEVRPGIYLDDRLSGISVHHNVIKNAEQGIFVGAGSDNNIHDNIFIDCKSAVTLISGGNSDTGAAHLFEEALDFLKLHENYISTFPTLSYIDPKGTFPRGNFIYDNLAVNSGFEVYNDEMYPYVSYGTGERKNRRFNNTIVDDFEGFMDEENENYGIKKSDPILETSPYLSDIDFSKIGMGKDSSQEYYILDNEYKADIIQNASDKLNGMSDTVINDDFTEFLELNELLAKAEVNDIIVSEYKNTEKYRYYLEEYEKYSKVECIPVDLSQLYNTGCIYTSREDVTGNAGYPGAFAYNDFINNPNIPWDSEWENGQTENTLTLNGVTFKMRVVDHGNWENRTNCVLYNSNETEYTNIDIDDGYYTSLEILANSHKPTRPYLVVRLNYNDKTEEVQRILWYVYHGNGDADGGISSRMTSANPGEGLGYIGHYSIPVDEKRKLKSIDILNDNYTEPGNDKYPSTAAIYAMTLMTNGKIKNSQLSYTFGDITYYDENMIKTDNFYDSPNGKFYVEAQIIKNCEGDDQPEIIWALYDDNGRMIDMQAAKYDTKVIMAFDAKMPINQKWSLKGFIWSSFDMMQPIFK